MSRPGYHRDDRRLAHAVVGYRDGGVFRDAVWRYRCGSCHSPRVMDGTDWVRTSSPGVSATGLPAGSYTSAGIPRHGPENRIARHLERLLLALSTRDDWERAIRVVDGPPGTRDLVRSSIR